MSATISRLSQKLMRENLRLIAAGLSLLVDQLSDLARARLGGGGNARRPAAKPC